MGNDNTLDVLLNKADSEIGCDVRERERVGRARHSQGKRRDRERERGERQGKGRERESERGRDMGETGEGEREG